MNTENVETTFPTQNKFVLDRYKDEIILRAEWTQISLFNGQVILDSKEKIMHFSTMSPPVIKYPITPF